MFIRHAQAQSFDPNSSGGDVGDVGATGNEGQALPTDRVYNEYRKLQRLHEKTTKELESLKGEVGPLKSQFARFQNMFSGVSDNGQDEKPLSYLDKVKRADRSIREADPSSNGLALTLEGAELIEKMRSENEQLRNQVNKFSSPQSIAENMMFVSLEGGIKDEMEKFFGPEGVDDNYPDFERVAISKLKEVQKDPKKWAQIIRSPEAQKQFCRSIIASKMPKLDNIPGWKKIDTYGVADAQRDLQRSEQLAAKARGEKNRDMMHQASQLAQKARQRLLPETLGLRFRDDE